MLTTSLKNLQPQDHMIDNEAPRVGATRPLTKKVADLYVKIAVVFFLFT